MGASNDPSLYGDRASAGGPRDAEGKRQLTLMLLAISLGLVLGSWAGGVLGWFLVFTRQYRRVRNRLAIGLGYLVIGVSSVGTLLLLLRTLERMGVGLHSSQRDAAVFAYAIGYGGILLLAGRSEIKWRRSVGLDDSKLMSLREKKN